MMPEFMVFVSPKGGSGATFTCAGIWNAFAKKGVKVLAVDLSGKRCALDFALGFQNYSVYNVSDVLDASCTLKEAMCQSTDYDNAFFLRGSADKDVDAEKLVKLFSKTDFEYVLIDAQCNENAGDILAFADKIIVVTDCTDVSVKICDAFSAELNWDKSYTVINKIIPAYIENKLMPNLDEIIDGIGLRPIGLIPWNPDALLLYSGKEEKISNKNLAIVFDNIATRITGGSVPAIDFKNYYECFKTKKRR